MTYDDKVKFQSEFVEQMKKRKKAFRNNTEICIDMKIYTNIDNSPHIKTIPKNYLDLISKPIDAQEYTIKYISEIDNSRLEDLL